MRARAPYVTRHVRLAVHRPRPHVFSPFGDDAFGRKAEAFARFFGTPTFLLVQSAIVVVWIALNVAAAHLRWDPYPFILLNLAFSLQAAYAAPLILLAQTRQADRDTALSASDAEHREALARDGAERQELAAEHTRELRALLESNTELTEQTRALTARIEQLALEIHGEVCATPAGAPAPATDGTRVRRAGPPAR